MVPDERTADAVGNEDPQDTGDGRELGVDIGSLSNELEDHSYPTSTEELVAEYGDHEIELSGESPTLAEVLGGRDDVNEEYESAEEVRGMIYNMVGAEAVGREEYSDRGGIASDTGNPDAESL